MLRFSNISFTGIVGYKQPTISTYAIVDEDNLVSSSGLYVQGASRIATIKNLKLLMEDDDISDEDFNTYLTEIINEASSNVLNQIFSEKPNLLRNELLYKEEYDFQHPLTLGTAFVGVEISVINKKELSNVINNIILSFNGTGTISLKLFQSGNKTAIQTKEVSVTDGETNSIVNWVLDYTSGVGGKYYLGYLTSALAISPYDREYEMASIPTSFGHFNVRPIKVVDWDSATLFDVNDIEYTSEIWGINLDMSTYWDYTDLVNKNKALFAKAVQIQAAIEILKVIAASTRSSETERIIKSRADLELNGNKYNKNIPESVGIINDLNGEIERLRKIFSEPRIKRVTLRS